MRVHKSSMTTPGVVEVLSIVLSVLSRPWQASTALQAGNAELVELLSKAHR